jgi:hypothetical protein
MMHAGGNLILLTCFPLSTWATLLHNAAAEHGSLQLTSFCSW